MVCDCNVTCTILGVCCVLKYGRANLAQYVDEMIFLNSNINIIWLGWKDRLLKCLNEHAKTVVIKHQHAPWIDSEIINLSNKKNTARRKYLKSKKEVDKMKYTKLSNSLKNLTKIKQQQYLFKVANNIESNPKRFWSLVKNKEKVNRLPKTMVHGNVRATTATEKAILFNNFFRDNFSLDNNQNLPYLEQKRDLDVGYPFFIVEDIVVKLEDVECE